MGTLGTGKRQGSDGESGIPRLHMDLHLLVAEKLDAGSPMNPSTPVVPSDRLWPDGQWMQQHAHLAWLLGFAPIPLALLAEWAGAATANAGGIDQPQTPIGLSTPLLGNQGASCWTPERPIGLEREVLAGEAASFPGGGRGR